MYSKVFSITLFSVLARVAFAQDFTFATPQLVQCKEAEFQWQGGNPGYAVYVLPFNDPCGDAVAEVGTTPNTSQNWNVTIPAGSQVQLLVEDSDSNEAWTGTITVQPSDDSSCIDPNAVKVLGAAGALGVTSTVVSSTAIASSSAVSSTTGAAAAALTPLPPAIAS
ncbi:hypothetical protein M422DRAFT_156784 [Sphaerobolus stellatus SS14]|nr:hypothetical protein M422DRAFT_156784 [Sphaerobolus stellatus SS14]